MSSDEVNRTDKQPDGASPAAMDPAAMDPLDFARLVKAMSTDDIRDLMQGDQRTAVLGRIFGDMPGVFRGDRAGATRAVIHWKVGDRPGGGADIFELSIADGTCRLSREPTAAATVAMTIGAVDFIRMVTGNANPITLFLRGKMRLSGDLGLAMKVPSLFEVPKP